MSRQRQLQVGVGLGDVLRDQYPVAVLAADQEQQFVQLQVRQVADPLIGTDELRVSGFMRFPQVREQAPVADECIVRAGDDVEGLDKDDDGRYVGICGELPEAVLDVGSDGRCGEAVDVVGVRYELHGAVPRMGLFI